MDVWKHLKYDWYVLWDEVEEKVYNYIKSYPEFDLYIRVDYLHIIGSICTNLYQDDTDIDVHLIPKEGVEWDGKSKEHIVDDVKSWSHSNPIYINKHPVELYIQFDIEQDFLSDGVYRVDSKEWLKGPLMYPLDYNPYEEFKGIYDKVREYAKDVDIDIGELKRDVIDYNQMNKAINNLPDEYKKSLMDDMERKLEEIEDNIEELIGTKDEWFRMRRESSKDIGKALDDIKVAKKFRNANAIFKFIDRYQYIRLIKDLEGLLKDDSEITDDEVEDIEKLVGISNDR
jgi:hypothetical protein